MKETLLEQPLVRVRDLSFHYGKRAIFDHVDLDIPRGKVVAIMGPSGCGKTTLLRILSGQIQPRSGSVVVDGLEVPRLSRAALLALRKRIGMLFQSAALLTDLSVFDNVAFPIREHTDLPEGLIRILVLMKLEAVGLRGARYLMPAALSGSAMHHTIRHCMDRCAKKSGHVDALMEVPTISVDTRAEGHIHLVWRGPLAEGQTK